MAKPINVLFITADQWRGDCLSALGHVVVKTPNLDDLAADGVHASLLPRYSHPSNTGTPPPGAAQAVGWQGA